MVVYEVNLLVDNDAAEEFAVWLRRHIVEMLGLDGFEGARWFYEEPAEDRQRWTIQYRLAGWKHLEYYVEHHAAEMQADAREHFDGRFSASRRVLMERESFNWNV